MCVFGIMSSVSWNPTEILGFFFKFTLSYLYNNDIFIAYFVYVHLACTHMCMSVGIMHMCVYSLED